jgi:hypothetical protein
MHTHTHAHTQVHVCGKFHCEEGLGIPEHLPLYLPRRLPPSPSPSPGQPAGPRVVTVVFVGAEEAAALGPARLARLADFVVITSPAAARPLSHPV